MDINNAKQNESTIENSQQKYLVSMPVSNYGCGWGSIAGFIICVIYYALENNLEFIPVIDMKHHNNQYFKDGRKLKDNTWEYFFEQPFNVTLDDVKKITDNSRITMCAAEHHWPYSQINIKSVWGNSEEFKDIQKYIRLNKQTKEYFEKSFNELFNGEKKVLGVLCRGTDYVHLKPINHPIPATPEMVIEEAKRVMKEFGYEKIYVATEDLEIYEKFKNVFKDKLIKNSQYKYGKYDDPDNMWLVNVKVNRENHQYRLGLEYLFSMYVLSHCKSLIANNLCSGLILVAVFSNFCKDMDYVKVFDRGKYKVRKKVKYNNIFERIFSIKEESYENTVWRVITILGLKFKSVKEVK